MAVRSSLALVRTLFCVVACSAIVAPVAVGQGGSSLQKGGQARPKPHLRIHAPRNGATVSGRIRWRVAFRGPRPRRIDLVVDGRVRMRIVRHHRSGAFHFSQRRGVATLDTTTLANGRHTLKAVAYGRPPVRAYRRALRRPYTSRVSVKVRNPDRDHPPNGGPTPAPPPTPTPAPAPGSMFWGASIGDHLTGTQAPWDMNAVSQFEGLAGKPLSIIHFGSPFANCFSAPCSNYAFPSGVFGYIRTHGAIPMLDWASQSIPSSLSEPDYQLSDVISGAHDAYIRSFAIAARDWGHPFFLRFNHEMNADWFSWSEGVNGNRPGEFVAAWRHVHDIFSSVGATNVSWVWCPNIDPENTKTNLQSLYPGNAYVDWTCLDGYNWSDRNPWASFDDLFSSTYHRIADSIAPTKPMIIGEIGSSERNGSKAAWISDMFAKLPSYPKIRGLLWFEWYADGADWPIETSATSTAAFAAGIANPVFTTNTFGSISASPIPPPG